MYNDGEYFDLQGFKKRLAHAMQLSAIPSSPSSLTRHFNAYSTDVKISVAGARRWVYGQNFPGEPRLGILAEMLKVSPHWLRFGDNPQPTISGKFTGVPESVLLLNDLASLDDESKDLVRNLVALMLKQQAHR
jgi:hypothetical protein